MPGPSEKEGTRPTEWGYETEHGQGSFERQGKSWGGGKGVRGKRRRVVLDHTYQGILSQRLNETVTELGLKKLQGGGESTKKNTLS